MNVEFVDLLQLVGADERFQALRGPTRVLASHAQIHRIASLAVLAPVRQAEAGKSGWILPHRSPSSQNRLLLIIAPIRQQNEGIKESPTDSPHNAFIEF